MSNIPVDIKRIYDPLLLEVVRLHDIWGCYRELFAGSQGRVDLLNKCASGFFYFIQEVLINDIYICLCKLTDSAYSKNSKKNKTKNLSLFQLQLELGKHYNMDLAIKNCAILCTLKRKIEPFDKWRNKKLAHSDWDTHFKVEPLPDIHQELIEEVLLMIRNYLNSIEQHYNNSEIEYRVASCEVDSLVTYLGYGLRYEELRSERKISFDDWQNCDKHDV